MWFIGVEVEQETRAPPPKKDPGSAPGGPRFFSAFPQVANGSAISLNLPTVL